MAEYNESKFNTLTDEINKKREELTDEISRSLGNGDTESYNRLKLLKSQCDAELRLLNYIKHDFNGDFFIC